MVGHKDLISGAINKNLSREPSIVWLNAVESITIHYTGSKNTKKSHQAPKQIYSIQDLHQRFLKNQLHKRFFGSKLNENDWIHDELLIDSSHNRWGQLLVSRNKVMVRQKVCDKYIRQRIMDRSNARLVFKGVDVIWRHCNITGASFHWSFPNSNSMEHLFCRLWKSDR